MGLYDSSVLFTGQTIQDVYQNAGFSLSVKARRQKLIISCRGWPGWWKRIKLHAEIISRVREFQLSHASEQTGLNFDDIQTDLDICENFDKSVRTGKFSMTAHNIARLLEMNQVSGFSMILNPNKRTLAITEGLCKFHFVSKDYPRLESIISKLGRGSLQIFHFLICAKDRSAQYRHLTSGYQFREATNINGARPIRDKYLLRSIYDIDRLEQMAELVNAGKLNRHFLDQCLLNYCVITDPESMVLLQRITTDEDGFQLTISEIARLFHRGIEPRITATMHELLQFGWLSFNQAEGLAKAGVLPELCEALDGLTEKPTIDQITRLHDAAEIEGLKRVVDILGQLYSPEKTINFFALRRELNSQVSDDAILEAAQAATSYLEARRALVGEREITPTAVTALQAPSRKRRELIIPSTLETPITVEPDLVGQPQEPMTYENVMVSYLPRLNGNAWLKRLRRCGWETVSSKKAGGSHVRIRKGPWEINFIQTGSRIASRYHFYQWFKRVRLPEEEVQLIINGGARKGRKVALR